MLSQFREHIIGSLTKRINRYGFCTGNINSSSDGNNECWFNVGCWSDYWVFMSLGVVDVVAMTTGNNGLK